MILKFNKISHSFNFGEQTVTLETGQIARQANAAVKIAMGDTVVLVAVTAKAEAVVGQDFFPLTVNYQEKTYAAGKIPGGYFKREGRPTEKETLTSRLIDRPVRPLFPKGFTNEVQIVATVLSLDPNVPTDIPAIIGAAAALAISGLPFKGPLAAARVGYLNGEYLLNPSNQQLVDSELDLVVAGTRNAVLMVESEAKELSESVMLGAVMFGHEQMQVAINAIDEFAKQSDVQMWDWRPPVVEAQLEQDLSAACLADVKAAYQIHDKLKRQERIKAVKAAMIERFCDAANESSPSEAHIQNLVHDLESQVVRQQIIDGEPRIDGRDTETVRPIAVEVGVLPRTHGSALFTRGETQALVVATLGTERDAQLVDDIEGEFKQGFMLHYNFPPYCVGECGFMSGPKRREIGHGRLARRGVQAVLPVAGSFPYTIRVVSEITESNGSSSMASVCGTSLALMDAGVPVKAPVAGIAMGLVKEGNKYAILSDIMGDEDHLGDMDFKVAGSAKGVTALQMDIKIDGITREIMERALGQANRGRMHILDIMNQALAQPRDVVSQFAPRIMHYKINPDKIRDVIGKGGATIRELTESTGTSIDIADDGTITVAAENTEAGQAAIERIRLLTMDLEVGQVYEGAVVKLVDFGAFVAVLPGRQGLLHISQIANERVENVTDYLQEGQTVRVKVIEIDRQGRVRLSMKQVEEV